MIKTNGYHLQAYCILSDIWYDVYVTRQICVNPIVNMYYSTYDTQSYPLADPGVGAECNIYSLLPSYIN